MACPYAVSAYLPARGGRPIFIQSSPDDVALQLPCGVCASCREAKVQEWSARCTIERARSRMSMFLTLTYADEHLRFSFGDKATVWPPDLRDFWKRLRWRLSPHCGPKFPIKYLATGEYGDLNERPHYHAIVFGLWPGDAKEYRRRPSGMLWRSDWLDDCWGLGHCSFGEVSPASAAYVARYIAGKYTKDWSRDLRAAPFLRSSHGLGVQEAFQVSVHDRVNIAPGQSSPTPRATLKKLRTEDPKLFEEIKASRAAAKAKRALRPQPPAFSVDAVAKQRLNAPREL